MLRFILTRLATAAACAYAAAWFAGHVLSKVGHG